MTKKKKFNVKHSNGKVTYAMRTGKVFVKSEMLLSLANYYITTGKDVTLSDKRGYGMEICVDDTYFFPAMDDLDAKVEEMIADTDEVAE